MTRLDLVGLLVSEGTLDEAVADAIRTVQSLEGGAVDTALLEAGVIDERSLQGLLERLAGQKNRVDPFARPAAAAVALLRPQQAARYRVVPFARDNRLLEVLTLAPDDIRTLDEIGFITGCRVNANVCTEVRLCVHLFRSFHVPLPDRMRALLEGRRPVRPDLDLLIHRMREKKRAKQQPEAANNEQLGSRGDLQLDWPSDLPRIGGLEKAPEQPPAVKPRPPTEPERPNELPGLDLSGTIPPVDLPPPRAEIIGAPERKPIVGRATTEPIAASAPAPRKIDRDELARELAGATDRDDIPPLVMTYLAPYLERQVVFSVKKHSITGWDARGAGLEGAVQTISVGRGDPSVVDSVASQQVPHVGAMPAGEMEKYLVIRLACGEPPAHLVIVPVVVKGRSVAVLYGEAADREARDEARAPMLAAAELMADALTRVILARKKQNSIAPSPEAQPSPTETKAPSPATSVDMGWD